MPIGKPKFAPAAGHYRWAIFHFRISNAHKSTIPLTVLSRIPSALSHLSRIHLSAPRADRSHQENQPSPCGRGRDPPRRVGERAHGVSAAVLSRIPPALFPIYQGFTFRPCSSGPPPAGISNGKRQRANVKCAPNRRPQNRGSALQNSETLTRPRIAGPPSPRGLSLGHT